jgi:hypothetical protein
VTRRRFVLALLLLLALATGGFVARSLWPDSSGPKGQRAPGRQSARSGSDEMAQGDASSDPAGSGSPGAPDEEPKAGADDEPKLLLFGRVLQPDRTPAVGAHVVLGWQGAVMGPSTPPKGLESAERNIGFHASTNADGRYEYWGRPGRWNRLPSLPRVSARLGARSAVCDGPKKAEPPVEMPDLVLGDALVLRGRIVDSTGQPVAGAWARIFASRGGLQEYQKLLAVSDAAGRVAYHAIARRDDWSLRLTVTHSEYPEVELRVDVKEQLARREFEVVLPAGFTITGWVVDQNGRPAPGVHVTCAPREEGEDHFKLDLHLRTRTDQKGRFSLGGVPAGECRVLLYVGLKRFSAFFAPRKPPYALPAVRGGNGETVDVGTARLEPTGVITGQVVDKDGAPIRGATVSASPPIWGANGVSVQSGKDGSFELAGLPPGEYRVLAQKGYRTLGTRRKAQDGVRPGDPPVVLRVLGGNALVLHFRPAGRLSEELPVQSYSCQFEKLPRPLDENGKTRGGMGGGSSIGRGRRAHWRREMKPGRYLVTVRVDGYERVELGEVTIHADRDTEVDVPLVPKR